MIISKNEPVKILLFSLVLLFIMGLCFCIAPDTVFADTAMAPQIPLACPQPPSGDGQAWVAVSDGFDVRVFVLFSQPASFSGVLDDVVDLGQALGFRLSDIDRSGKTITINCSMPGSLSYYYSVTRWDSDGPSYRPLSINRVATGQINESFSTWVQPLYVAYGGDIGFAVEGVSTTSFVPLWNYGSSDSSGSSQNYWSALNSISESLHNINLITGNMEYFLEENLGNTSAIADTLDSLYRIQSDLSLALIAKTDSDGDIYYSISSSLDRVTSPEFFEVLDDLNSNLSSLDGLGDSVEALNQVIASMEYSFSQISQELQELTSVMEAEQQIWEDASSDYSYDTFSDDSVESWSWFFDLIGIFSDASSDERSEEDLYYGNPSSPDVLEGRLQVLDFTYFFGQLFGIHLPSRPSDYAWNSINIGGLP